MKILITGGAGYIGTALCHRLMQDTAVESVTVYDNLSRNNYNLLIGKTKLDQRFHMLEGDILDSRKLRKAVKEADVVFHLAAKVTTPFADQNAHLFEQVNHWGSAEVSYAVEESAVSKLIYLSSVSVYGSGEEEKTLQSTLNPGTFYGISKMRGEEHIARLADKTEIHVFRCGNVYGYNRSMRFDAVINKFMLEANFHGRINVQGTGRQRRPFIHVDAVAEALAGVLHGNVPAGYHHLVEDNFEVMEVVGVLKDIFPDLEMIFINHNMKLRELSVKPDGALVELHPEPLVRLRERLHDFKKEFAF